MPIILVMQTLQTFITKMCEITTFRHVAAKTKFKFSAQMATSASQLHYSLINILRYQISFSCSRFFVYLCIIFFTFHLLSQFFLAFYLFFLSVISTAGLNYLIVSMCSHQI